MLIELFYRLLWQSLHLLCSIYETIVWWNRQWQLAMAWSYDFCYCCLKGSHDEYFRRCRKELGKVPQHLNLIIGPDEPRYAMDPKQLARIIKYALSMNIRFISFYDLRTNDRRITMADVPEPAGWQCKHLDDNYHVWRSPLSAYSKKEKNGYANGVPNGHATEEPESIEILELQPHHGHALIAEVCRSLYESGCYRYDILQQPRKQLEEIINKELLTRLYKIPDPELSIVFNSNLCTFGIMPWQLRFTEFHKSVSSGSSSLYFDKEAFVKILYKYSRCEQRFGR